MRILMKVLYREKNNFDWEASSVVCIFFFFFKLYITFHWLKKQTNKKKQLTERVWNRCVDLQLDQQY